MWLNQFFKKILQLSHMHKSNTKNFLLSSSVELLKHKTDEKLFHGAFPLDFSHRLILSLSLSNIENSCIVHIFHSNWINSYSFIHST